MRASQAVSPLLSAAPTPRHAFSVAPGACRQRSVICSAVPSGTDGEEPLQRRQLLSLAALLAAGAAVQPPATQAAVEGYEKMPLLEGKDYGKSRMRYSDYVQADSGLQYQDLREGTGPLPQAGQTCVVDWSGVTIGYYGRPFEARNKAKGGAFTGDEKDFYRFTLGAHTVIPGFEEAVTGMKVGGIRRIIVPVELGYPNSDFNKLGPKPSTFSGRRALDFVLKNQGMIDKTLLFDIELLKAL